MLLGEMHQRCGRLEESVVASIERILLQIVYKYLGLHPGPQRATIMFSSVTVPFLHSLVTAAYFPLGLRVASEVNE